MPDIQGNIEVEESPRQYKDSENQLEKKGKAEEPPQEPSPLFKFISNVFYIILLCSLGITLGVTLFTLDFLDIYTFRNDIPEAYRKGWPLEAYYEFVKLHQLPEEERYQQLIYTEQRRYDKLITDGNKNLEDRAKSLEESYRALVRTQKEQSRLEQEALRKQQEELAIERKKLEEGLADLEKRKAAMDVLSNKLASEAINIESSLIKFMERENRLDQVCSIAAQMDPKALARVFDEVPDDQLIYDIMGGLQPSHSAKTLSNMDPEKAGKIMKMGNNPIILPPPGNSSRSYIPQSLTNLINETQANKRN